MEATWDARDAERAKNANKSRSRQTPTTALEGGGRARRTTKTSEKPAKLDQREEQQRVQGAHSTPLVAHRAALKRREAAFDRRESDVAGTKVVTPQQYTRGRPLFGAKQGS